MKIKPSGEEWNRSPLVGWLRYMSTDTVLLFCLRVTFSFFRENLLAPAGKTPLLPFLSPGGKMHSPPTPGSVMKARMFMSQAHVPTEHNDAFKKEQVSKVLPTIPLFWIHQLERHTFLHDIFWILSSWVDLKAHSSHSHYLSLSALSK